MTESVENSGSFSDPSQAARLRDILSGIIEDKVKALTPTRMTGMVLDIYQGGPTFNSDITVDSTIIPRTQDNPERPYVAKIRLDDKFEGGIVEARIDPNLIPIFRKADFFDEENPAGSGTMVDRAGRYITVEVTDDGSAPVDDTYPSLIGTTLQAPQVAPRVALVGSAASWRVSELIRGVLAIQTNPATLMLGPDYARFDTNTLTWGGTIAFARGSEIKAYEIYPDAPIVTYGSEPLEVSPTEPVEIVLGQRSGSMYLNFSATDGVPVLVWVEAGSDTPIPPEWYLVFARINDGDLSSKLVFSSLTDFRSPSAPDNLVLTYAKTGYEKLGLTASWNEVVEGTNGDPISISGYELWGMLNEEDWRRITTTTDTHVAGLTFDSSSEWHFKVRAMGQNGIPGVFSAVEAVTFPEETEVIGGGSKTYWQPDKPTEGNPGDEWFDTNDGNAHYIFDEVANDYVAAPFGSGALDEYVNNLINTAVSDAASASENAGLAITAANGKNTIFIQAAKPSLTGRVLGDTWFDTDDGNKIYSFDGANFVAGLLGTAAIADAAITNAKIANLDAAKVTTGTLAAGRIAAKSISVGKLTVADLTNNVENPGFENGLTSWTKSNAWTYNNTNPHSGTYKSLVLAAATTETLISDTVISVVPGDTWVLTVWAHTDMTGTGAIFSAGVIWDTGATLVQSNDPNNVAWTKYTFTFTVPTGVKTAQVRLAALGGTASIAGYVRVDDVALRRANTSELIVDGSIIASKLAVGAITAGSAVIADGAIGNAKISDLKVDKLTGGTLQSDINLAAKIQAGDDSLGLVLLDATGIRVIDGTGVQQTAFNTTGSSVFKGDIEAAGIEAAGKVKLNANNNEISSAGVLVLATGVSAPSTAPQVTPFWTYIQLKDSTGADLKSETDVRTISGVTRDTANGEWVSLVYVFSSDRCVAYRHNADGTFKSTIGTFPADPTADVYGPGGGVALIGRDVWRCRTKEVYSTTNFSWTITFQAVKLDGTVKTLGTYEDFTVLYYGCQIASATSTQIVAYFTDTDGSGVVTLFNVSSSAKASTWATAPASAYSYPALAYADFGAGTRYALNPAANFVNYTVAGVAQATEDWPTATGSASVGFGIYSSIPWSAHGDGKVYFYDGPNFASGSEPRFTYVWRDSKSAGTGYHETSESPISGVALPKKRARMRVTTAALQATAGGDGVDSIRVYGAYGTGQRYHQAVGTTSTYDFQTLATSGTKPGGVAAFPDATPAVIRNPDSSLIIRGNGLVKVLGFDPVGAIAGSSVDWNDLSTAGVYPYLMHGTTNPNGTGVNLYYYVHVYTYATGSVAQVAIPYTDGTICFRYRYSGTWGAWKKVDYGIADYPRCAAQSTTNLSLSSSYTRITGLTELYDNDAAYTPATGFYVTPEAGVYRIEGGICFTTASTRRFLQLETGTAAAGSNTSIARVEGPATDYASLIVSRELQLAAGVSVAMVAYAAAATTTNGSFAPNWFSIRRVA